MKKIIILFFFILFQNLIAQKSELFGKITLQNSGGKPLSGVQVSAIDASPTSSLSNGLFKLVFNSLKPGDPVTITIEKHGFDIVNSKDLELLILRNNPKTNVFKIVMCKEGEKEKKQMEYYNISSNYYNELIEKFEDILKYRNGTEVNLQVTKDSLAYVKKMWKSKQLIINELSEKFSEINLDDIDSLYKIALVNFKKGNTQKAQNILSPIVLQTNISSAKLELSRLSIINNEIQLRKSNAKKILKNAVDGYILKADMFTMTFKFDSSEFYYEKAIEADSTNINSYITYHLYLSKQNQHEKALEIGKKALLFTKEVYDSLIVCQFIGISYYNILDYYNSESYLIQALKHWVSFRDSAPNTYDNQYVSIHRSLGNTYIELGHYEKAESSYKNCQRIIDLLKKNNMKEYDEEYLSINTSIGRLYAIKNVFDKSENYYSNALKKYNSFSKTTRDKHKKDYAILLFNLGHLEEKRNNIRLAQEYNDQALTILEELASTNYPSTLPDLAKALSNKGAFFYKLENKIESIEYTNESIKLYEILSESNPKAFLPYLFSSLSNLATIYYHFSLKDSLENLYSRIIDLSTQLKDKHPAFDKALYANNMNGLGLVYFNRKKYDSALSSYEEALSVFRDLSKASPKTYEPNIAQIKRNIGNLYLDKKEFDKSLSFYEDALKIYQKYAKKNPEVYLPNVARTLHNIAVSFYLEKKEGYKAENYFHQAIKIKQGLVKKFPGIYESELVETIDNLAGLYISFNKFEEAKKYTNMSNAIRSKVMNLNEEKKAITWIKKNNEALKLFLQKNMYKYASELGELNIARILSISSSTLDDYLKASSNNYSMLGYAYLKQSKIELAETNFETAKNLAPNNIKLHFYLSCLYAVKKDTTKAIIHFKKSIDLGFDDYESIKKESFLESFQNEEFYKEILRKMDK